MAAPSDAADLGEFSLIERIVSRLGEAAARDILVPPGDDAAAWAAPAGATIVATIDVLTEGNHWHRDTMGLADAGWRAVAANVSDLAAMGATADYLLVGLSLGPDVSTEDVEALTEGMAESCRAHHVRIAGGDVVRGATTSISIAAYGHASPSASAPSAGASAPSAGAPALLRRSGAQPGDRVAVTGAPGASGAGLQLLLAGRAAEAGAEPLLRAHRRPRARLAVGQAAIAAGVTCGIDVSDGLLQDLGHVAAASRVGIQVAVAALPLHQAAVDLLGAEHAVDLALGGGEDFELVLCGPRDVLRRLDTPEVPVTLIGRVVAEHPGEVVAWTDDGEAYEPPVRGWDQLRV